MPSVRSRPERVGQATALAIAGGFLDAYTYLAHGGVFANAQTGNVVLLGVEAAGGHASQALRHLPPLAAFLVGMLTVEVLARSRDRATQQRAWTRHPTRIVLDVEILTFTIVGLLPPATPDIVATTSVAWAATLQVGTFRDVRGAAYNSTFTTGNLRSLVSEAAAWRWDGNAASGQRARALLVVVIGFAGGAVLGGVATRRLHTHAILLVSAALVFLLADIVVQTRRLRSTSKETPRDATGRQHRRRRRG